MLNIDIRDLYELKLDNFIQKEFVFEDDTNKFDLGGIDDQEEEVILRLTFVCETVYPQTALFIWTRHCQNTTALLVHCIAITVVQSTPKLALLALGDQFWAKNL